MFLASECSSVASHGEEDAPGGGATVGWGQQRGGIEREIESEIESVNEKEGKKPNQQRERES